METYKAGDRVRLINYRVAVYSGWVDIESERIGWTGTIMYSYLTKYGGSGNREIYCVDWEEHGQMAWFELDQLEKI